MRTPWAIAPLLACLALSAVPASAGMIATDQLLSAQHVKVDAFLARADVQRELEAFGVSPADAASRAASLTEAELQVVVNRIDTLPAGGRLSTLELVLVILLIVILI
jgi:hypothetical protein